MVFIYEKCYFRRNNSAAITSLSDIYPNFYSCIILKNSRKRQSPETEFLIYSMSSLIWMIPTLIKRQTAIFANRALYSVAKMCRALEIKQCVYYQWTHLRAKKERRKAGEKELADKVRSVFEENRKLYGCRKMRVALINKGVILSEWKIRRIMRENGLYPVTLCKFKPYKNGKSDGIYSENVIKRNFTPEKLNKVWAGDITYIQTGLGWVYLAAVLDLNNKEVIGYEVSKNIDSELSMNALGNAIALRGKHKGLIFHSDRGSQYSSKKYKAMLNENGITGSMSAPGCPYDNSCVESFFASLKKELTYRRKYDTIEEVKTDVFRYIELFYNRKRLHSSFGYMSPVDYRLAHSAG